MLEMLSRAYGWTPTQILEQPADILLAYFDILSAREILKAHQQKAGHGN